MINLQAKLRSSTVFNRLGTMFGKTQFCYAEKPGGVEPGFRAIDLDKAFFEELLLILQTKSHEIKFQELIESLEGGELEQQQIAFAGFIRRHVNNAYSKELLEPDIKDLCEQIKQAVSRNKQLSAWMYKLDYVVGQRSRIEGNKAAIREYVGTRLAGIFSQKNQKQELVWLQHDKESYALLACSWKNNLQELKPFLHGGGGPDYCGIFVEDNHAAIKYSKYIPGLGPNLIFNLAIGDRDSIGKDGRNKGIADGAFYGYDYGKPYEGTGICASLKDDFSFSDWAIRTPAIFRGSSFFGIARHYLYRNYNVFYDTSLSERMLGVHLLKKMISGENPSEEIIESYSSLRQELDRIESCTPAVNALFDCLNVIKEKYSDIKGIKNLVERLSNQLDKKKLLPFDLYFIEIEMTLIAEALEIKMPMVEIEDYLSFIEGMQALASKNNQDILAVFTQRLLLTSTEIDLLDKLEKIFSPTSVLSRDGTVFLNTMRIEPAHQRIPFQLLKYTDGTYMLSTTESGIRRKLRKKYKLDFSLRDNSLSCNLTKEDLERLMDKVENDYHKKRECLLIAPTYELIIIPNLLILLNDNIGTKSRASISHSFPSNQTIELAFTLRTKKQGELIKTLFNLQVEPTLHQETMITILPKQHGYCQTLISKSVLEKNIAKATRKILCRSSSDSLENSIDGICSSYNV